MKNILIACGGQSLEHSISLLSAKTILTHIDKTLFRPILSVVTKSGDIRLIRSYDSFSPNPTTIMTEHDGEHCYIENRRGKAFLVSKHLTISLDAAFPIIHGTTGEDGAIQGFFKLMNIPFVGADIFGCNISMNKEKARSIAQGIGVKSIPFILSKGNDISYHEANAIFKTTKLIIKSHNIGSSIGISTATNQDDFELALEDSLQYSDIAMIEPYIPGVDVECAILSGRTSRTATIKTQQDKYDIYSYKAKYLDKSAAQITIPGDIPQEIEQAIQHTTQKLANVFESTDMARMDYRLTKNNEFYFSEFNTIPGFTDISAYPKLFLLEDISITQLITELLQNTIDKQHNFLKKQSASLNFLNQ